MSNTKTRVCAGVLLFCLLTLSAGAMISRAESVNQGARFDQQYPEKPPDDPFKARLIPKNSKIYIAPIMPEEPDKP